MLELIRRLAGKKPQEPPPPPSPALPLGQVTIDGIGVVDLAASCITRSGSFLFVDWKAVESLLAPLSDTYSRSAAWAIVQQEWLECMAAMMGTHYHVVSSPQALVLSATEPNVAKASLKFLDTTRGRIIGNVLKGIAQAPELGKAVLIILDTQEEYYEYVSHYYPGEGEFAVSAGIYIHDGSGHFLTVRHDLLAIEPTIAHELTHACLAHLPIPAWLNEGIAVNTELRLSQSNAVYGGPMEIHRKLQAWWTEERIQDFWCGRSFVQADEGCGLSYDLGRIIVEQMGRHWPSFQAFALHANRSDAGQAAAEQHRDVTLGAYVCALLEKDYDPAWEPAPEKWAQEPEKGAF